MPAGGLVAGGVIAAAGLGVKAWGDYKARKAQERAAKKAAAEQKKLLEEERVRQTEAAAQANVLMGSEQGLAQLRQSAGEAGGYLREGFRTGREDLSRGETLAMERLSAGQAAAQGTLQRTADQSEMARLMRGGLAAEFQADPGYAFRLQEGEKALRRRAAASGGRLGSAALKSMLGYSSDLASQEYGNYAQRAIGMAGTEDARRAQLMSMLAGQQYGVGAAGAGYAGNLGSNLANLATGQGGALANVAMTSGSNLANMMYNSGVQQGANIMAGAGATLPIANNVMQQYANQVPYAGAGYQTMAGVGGDVAQIGGSIAMGGLARGGGSLFSGGGGTTGYSGYTEPGSGGGYSQQQWDWANAGNSGRL